MSSLKVNKTKQIKEEEEEEVGLACPPLDEWSYMLDEQAYFDLEEDKFFSGIEDFDVCRDTTITKAKSENTKAVAMETACATSSSFKKSELVKKPAVDKVVRTGTNTSAKPDNSGPVSSVKKPLRDEVMCIASNTLMKPDQGAKKPKERPVIPKDAVSFEAKLESTKRKLLEQYSQVERERKRRQILQFTNDLPPPPPDAEAKLKFIRRGHATLC